MAIEDFKLVRLTSDHNILPFDCDDKDLNEFIFEDAKAYQSQLLAVTYLLESYNTTIAFFSIFNDKITLEDFDSKSLWKKLSVPYGKRKRSYPAVKLGRLAINVENQKQGIGKDILNYLKISFIDNNKTGCRFITVDAYSKSFGFYEKNGFEYITLKDAGEDTRLMFFDLSALVT